MRRLTRCLLCAVIVCAGCGHPPQTDPPEASATTTTEIAVDPARIQRVRGDLPPGYEVADASSAVSPVDFWGFKSGWTAAPPQCAALLDPVPAAVAQGLSGSGDGGLLYVVVATARSGPIALDPAIVESCGHWAMTYGRSSANVRLLEAPRIDGVATAGMAAEITTVVESGTETASRADTFTAYLGDHFLFVTLISDPGSLRPPLPARYAADLLVSSVAALRG